MQIKDITVVKQKVTWWSDGSKLIFLGQHKPEQDQIYVEYLNSLRKTSIGRNIIIIIII